MSFEQLLQDVEQKARDLAGAELDRIERASVFVVPHAESMFGVFHVAARYSQEDRERYVAHKASEARERLMSGLMRMALTRDTPAGAG